MRAVTQKIQQEMCPSLLSNDQKKLRIDASLTLLSLLGMHAQDHAEGIAAGDESWFQCASDSDSVFAGSRESAMRRIGREISGQQIMLALFFTTTRLLVLKTVPKDPKFNHDYFSHAIFPGLNNEKMRISRKESFLAFSVHMDNSKCHNGNKIPEKLAKRSIE
jgi:hypothetical protein